MPLSLAAISYDISDYAGVDFDPRRTKVYATNNVIGGAVIDTDGNKVYLGSGNATIAADGTGSISVPIPGTGSNPASWQTTIHVDYPDRNNPRGRTTRSFGPFTITASANLADLVPQQEVPAEYVTQVTAQLDAKVTKAQAAATAAGAHRAAVENVVITDLGTTDGQTKTLIETDGTLTRAALSATFAPRGGDKGRGGRGAISITFDDGDEWTWTELVPVCKELGFPIGIGWVTGNGYAVKAADAHAAGCELIGHGVAHEDMSLLTETQLIANAQSQVAKIAAITGEPDNIAFIYPEHKRNAQSDRVLSRYFTTGRGRITYTPIRSGGSAWLTAGVPFDLLHTTGGDLAPELVRILANAAATGARVPLYGHYGGVVTNPGRVTALRNLVALARHLGMDIVRPSDLYGGRPGTDIVPARWTMTSDVTITTEQSIRPGASSFKVTPNAPGGNLSYPSFGENDGPGYFRPTVGEPGLFGVYRMSLRYKATSPITTHANGGVVFKLTTWGQDADGGLVWALPASAPGSDISRITSPIPAAEWGLLAKVVTLGPEAMGVSLGVLFNHLNDSQAPFYLADFRFERIDTVASRTFDVTLNGTTPVTLPTDIVNVERCGVNLTPKAAVAGNLWYDTTAKTEGSTALRIYSTDAADVGQIVRVTITPGIGVSDYTLATTGA